MQKKKAAPEPMTRIPAPRKARSGVEETFLQYLERYCGRRLGDLDVEMLLLLAREVGRQNPQ